MTYEEITGNFQSITMEFGDIHNLIERKPLLAHYTSIATLESIISRSEIWFSHPLFMNDLQEMRFGIHEGMNLLMQHEKLAEWCGSQDRAELVKCCVRHYFEEFEKTHALDIYVFCLSKHDTDDMDGRLSMWRAYGGQGNGAALIFNTSFITFNQGSPLVIAKAHYKSHHDRMVWLQDNLQIYLTRMQSLTLSDETLFSAAFHVFNLFKMFALIFKHHGFSEEQEWRIIYMPDRDVTGVLADKRSYYLGPRGVEPKLKFPIAPLNLPNAGEWKFSDIIERIILGPSVSSPLAKASISRMLEKLGRPEFVERVIATTIPLRAGS